MKQPVHTEEHPRVLTLGSNSSQCGGNGQVTIIVPYVLLGIIERHFFSFYSGPGLFKRWIALSTG